MEKRALHAQFECSTVEFYARVPLFQPSRSSLSLPLCFFLAPPALSTVRPETEAERERERERGRGRERNRSRSAVCANLADLRLISRTTAIRIVAIFSSSSVSSDVLVVNEHRTTVIVDDQESDVFQRTKRRGCSSRVHKKTNEKKKFTARFASIRSFKTFFVNRSGSLRRSKQ